MVKRMLVAGIGVGLCSWLLAGEARATTIAKQYTGPRYDNAQCVFRNDTGQELYAVGQWVACDRPGTVVEDWGGTIIRPQESKNLISNDARACRCVVTHNGKAGDISISFGSGTGHPAAGYAVAPLGVCLARNVLGCSWVMAYDYWIALPSDRRPPIAAP